MFSPRVKPSASSKPKSIKLPTINSRGPNTIAKDSHSQAKKKQNLPSIKNIKSKKKISINKENQSGNFSARRPSSNNSLEQKIEDSKHQIQLVQKKVKHIFGGCFAEQTLELGQDLTNFERKVEQNRQLIKRHKNNQGQGQGHQPYNTENRNKKEKMSQTAKTSPSILVEKTDDTHQKIESISSKNSNKQENMHAGQLQKGESNLAEEANTKLHDKQFLQQNLNKDNKSLNVKRNTIAAEQKSATIDFQSSVNCRKASQKKSRVFQSIKEILDDPQKKPFSSEKYISNDIRRKKVQFTISQLEEKLRKLDSQRGEISGEEGYDRTGALTRNSHYPQQQKMKTLSSVKSLGYIPAAKDQLLQANVQWKKIIVGSNKSINEVQSSFDQQVEFIKKWEKKSHNSILTMIENKKLLMALKAGKDINMPPLDKKSKK